MIDAALILSMLEQPCEACAAKGHIDLRNTPTLNGPMTCGACDGSGQALTDLGHEVIGFVGRHLFPVKWAR